MRVAYSLLFQNIRLLLILLRNIAFITCLTMRSRCILCNMYVKLVLISFSLSYEKQKDRLICHKYHTLRTIDRMESAAQLKCCLNCCSADFECSSSYEFQIPYYQISQVILYLGQLLIFLDIYKEKSYRNMVGFLPCT